MDTDGLIDATAAPIYELGGAYCFADATAPRGEALGLDVFMFYCLGRGGVLGDVDAATVAERLPLVQAVRWSTTWWDEGRAVGRPRRPSRRSTSTPRTTTRDDVQRDRRRSARSARPRHASSTPPRRHVGRSSTATARFALPDDVRRAGRSSSSSSCASCAAARTARRSPPSASPRPSRTTSTAPTRSSSTATSPTTHRRHRRARRAPRARRGPRHRAAGPDL